MNCLSSAFPEWNAFTSEMLFAYFHGGVMLGTPHIVQEPDYQMSFCWNLGAYFDKTLFHRDLGTWEESLYTSKSELKRGLTKISIYSLALGHLSGTFKIQRIVCTDPSTF